MPKLFFVEFFLFFISLPSLAVGYKMAIFVPNMANSQVLFSVRVAETLAKAKLDVTMIMITPFDDAEHKYVKIDEEVKVHYVNASCGIRKADFDEMMHSIIFEDVSVWDPKYYESMGNMTDITKGICRKLLENKAFLKWLAAEKFDLAFAHIMSMCSIGIIHLVKIPTWIWLDSTVLMDHVAHYVGVPIIPSYVPPMLMESTDHMNFLERTKSLIGHTLTDPMWRWMLANDETSIFRKLIDPNFPDLIDLSRNCPLVMTNANEIYDPPRPILAKVVNIGGLGIQLKDVKPLAPVFQEIVDSADGIIVFSFGSITPSDRMPMSWKSSFLDAFKRFPKYHFIWRYVGTDLQELLPPNVHTFTWIPQSDLMQHNKTKALITHGGYNSIQEAIAAGIPFIPIPLFADQPLNAKLAEQHKISITIQKANINADTIADAIKKITTDQSYSRNVKRLSQMVKKKPVSSSHLLVSWAEFVAEFKTLDNLVPAGNNLNFIQYHSLDVIGFIIFDVVLVLFVSYKIAILVTRKLCSALLHMRKTKND